MRTTLALLVTFGLSLSLRAEEPKAEPAAETAEQLAQRQAEVGRRLKSLEETMRRISRILAKSDPEKAARLEMAMRRSLEEGNLRRVEEIQNYLESKLFQEALNEQRELSKALERILDILLDRDSERKETAERIEQLKQLSQQLEQILQEETQQFHETEKHVDPEKTLQRARDAKAKLQELIARQQAMAETTRAGGAAETAGLEELKRRLAKLEADQKAAKAGKGAQAQEEVAKGAEALAGDLAKAALEAGTADHPAQRAAEAVARAAQGMASAASKMQAGESAGEAQEGVEQDLREAREALERMAERLPADRGERLARQQEQLRRDTERLQKDVERLAEGTQGADSGAGALGRAQDEMKEAEKGLQKGAAGAVPHQEAAKRELEEAYKKLEELERELKKLIELPNYDAQAEKQDATTEKTEELLKKMEQKGGGGTQGAPTPGQSEVEQAKRAMQQASRNLRNRSSRDANADQKEAVERLQKAKKDLEDALRQLREEMQLMLLEAMERRFAAMLQKQRQITKDTIALNLRLRQSPEPSRADRDSAARLSALEGELASEAEKALEILKEEGSTVVIPEIVLDLKADLDNLAAMLAKLATDEYTQQIQRDVEITLEQLLRVIQEEVKRRDQKGQGGEGDPMEGDQEENLLPTSAELKMLKEMQVQVNRRTEFFERKLQAGTQEVAELDEERTRVAKKQGAVGDLTRSMADKINRQNEG
ncbi:MAG: hypothetical protein ACT4PV_09730 [Planctomycetaceae bacterium]